ncbi:cilia- and flagella-associated protein 141-like [Mytilus trossulus]|uniref:cilia- and flagella-associated protein 141-like n=1 Tax=Mytilus trossulus TaxID=6551 RepID=UPI0030060C85
MSMSTSLRYELNTGGSKAFKESRLRQQERIQTDEMMADRQNVVRLELITNQRAGWHTNLEKASWNKNIQHQDKKIQEELRLAARASLAVRQKALQNQIARDSEKYEQELHLKGKTFFKQRI